MEWSRNFSFQWSHHERCFIPLNSAFPDYSRCYFLIMGSETKTFLYTRCALGIRSVESCRINVLPSKKFSRYGKMNKYSKFSKKGATKVIHNAKVVLNGKKANIIVNKVTLILGKCSFADILEQMSVERKNINKIN